ncbi:uncharacterized protein BDZ99DRAFT_207817 [Mytilinidion resinicola]|uniref:Uncharacterized protein n=1 Tax=Mytilinidion resinicola TaxID=574789 RepID=A0A6A6Y0K9_9PEZI|nr:uncharacterized protein BDZ99DRAFT_207817 [Mytilinidion resinicola]KAF2802302.1 hypothetical protein BDZ99DRAFT_207817 [Mytilinidion resinicola]
MDSQHMVQYERKIQEMGTRLDESEKKHSSHQRQLEKTYHSKMRHLEEEAKQAIDTLEQKIADTERRSAEDLRKGEAEAKALSDELATVNKANEKLDLERKHLQQDLEDAQRKSQHSKRKLEVSAKEIQEAKNALIAAEKEKEHLTEQSRRLQQNLSKYSALSSRRERS